LEKYNWHLKNRKSYPGPISTAGSERSRFRF
jgi:hypothetical protein